VHSSGKPFAYICHRYEREINRCERPAIRLIQERDASPSSAMVLCVFEISWPSGTRTDTVAPELVLTDGWYKIRAQTDVALARAVKKNKIRVGSKLEIIGAKVSPLQSWVLG
jgi:breast cancer 2 susceptibility protein